jgi:hypothetical protein
MSASPTPPAAPKTRERRHAARYRYLSRVAGGRYEARLFLGGGKRHGVQMTLGLYPEERLAWLAVKAVLRLRLPSLDPLAVWLACRPLMASGVVRPDLLPKYVRLNGRHRGYWALVHRRGGTIELPGPYPTPEDAHRAMLARLAGGRGAGVAGHR